MKRFFPFLLAIVLLLQGCSSFREIELADVELGKLKMISLTSAQVQVMLMVDNPTNCTFKVTDMDICVRNGDVEFARVVLPQSVDIPPGNPAQVCTSVNVEVSDPLALLAGGLSLNSVKSKGFKVDTSLRVKKGLFKKRFIMEDIPLSAIIDNIKLRK